MRTSLLLLAVLALGASCQSPNNSPSETKTTVETPDQDPKAMLRTAYQLFKEGNDSASVALANEVLAMGKATQNDTLVGRALTSLCRNSQRKQDTQELARLSAQLVDLSQTTGDTQWMMYMAHMNAEMYRLIGDMEKAERYYNQSLAISEQSGATGMYTIDHFNKSFVMTATGRYEEAGDLIQKYYALRLAADSTSEDAYGLIALAYLLDEQGDAAAAHRVSVSTRKLFEAQHIFPEPPDEQPLLAVEAHVKSVLPESEYAAIAQAVADQEVSANALVEKYLK